MTLVTPMQVVVNPVIPLLYGRHEARSVEHMATLLEVPQSRAQHLLAMAMRDGSVQRRKVRIARKTTGPIWGYYLTIEGLALKARHRYWQKLKQERIDANRVRPVDNYQDAVRC